MIKEVELFPLICEVIVRSSEKLVALGLLFLHFQLVEVIDDCEVLDCDLKEIFMAFNLHFAIFVQFRADQKMRRLWHCGH